MPQDHPDSVKTITDAKKDKKTLDKNKKTWNQRTKTLRCVAIFFEVLWNCSEVVAGDVAKVTAQRGTGTGTDNGESRPGTNKNN